jgi:LPS-assembly lipoprotein
MSWCSRRYVCARLAAFAGAAAVAACGFRPLYGRHDGVQVSRALGQVDIAPIEDPEFGPALHDALATNLAPRASDSQTRYRLAVQLSSSRQAQVTAEDTLTRRFALLVTARYSLVEQATGAALDEGSVSSASSYNIIDAEPFATRVAEQDAGRQAARELGREIVNRLALYFASHPAS